MSLISGEFFEIKGLPFEVVHFFTFYLNEQKFLRQHHLLALKEPVLNILGLPLH